jgi:hypothetical protein
MKVMRFYIWQTAPIERRLDEYGSSISEDEAFDKLMKVRKIAFSGGKFEVRPFRPPQPKTDRPTKKVG